MKKRTTVGEYALSNRSLSPENSSPGNKVLPEVLLIRFSVKRKHIPVHPNS